MKTNKILFLIFFMIESTIVLAQNKIHPQFFPLDENGSSIAHTTKMPSVSKTCGACHDTQYIADHTTHKTINCVTCHLSNADGVFLDKLPMNSEAFSSGGLYSREVVKNISQPGSKVCQHCHDIKTESNLPQAFDDQQLLSSMKNWKIHLWMSQGSFFSPQKISSSFINVKDKNINNQGWDVHAQRQLQCVDCHYNKNNPQKAFLNQARVNHLRYDIRQKYTFNNYFEKPNHQLVSNKCVDCHDPLSTHKIFPYRERHLAAVKCQACHIPSVRTPIPRSVDMTMLSINSAPQFKFWNADISQMKSGELNTRLVKEFYPFLLRQNDQLTPYNIISVRYWKNGDQDIQAEELSKIIWNMSSRNELLKVFDANHNSIIEDFERIVDSDEKIKFLSHLLIQNGIKNPRIVEEKFFIPLNHGIVSGKDANRDCQSCHGQKSRIELQHKDLSDKFNLNSRINVFKGSKASLPEINTYVIGTSKIGWIDRFGLYTLILMGFFVVIHATLRFSHYVKEKNRSMVKIQTNKEATFVKMYGRYERFWHWGLAISTSMLLITGVEIHYAGTVSLLGLQNAVLLHNSSAALFLANSIVSIIYYLSTRQITQFLPSRFHLWEKLYLQLRFYSFGIYRGHAHPIHKTPEEKMNPLQQLTYLLLLNILLPMQMMTGVLMWGIDKWSVIASYTKNYEILGPMHTLGAWGFVIFLVMHIYLTTTGETVLTNIKAMLTGDEKLLKGDDDHE